MGVLNILPAYVEFPSHQQLVILGGQKASVFHTSGTIEFFAHSADGNDPWFSTNRMAWCSNKVTVDLKPDQVLHYVLDGSDHQQWILKPEKE